MTLAALMTELQQRVRSRSVETDCGYATPCWISNRAKQGNGYTKMGLCGDTLLTHRVAYEAFVGSIPDGMQIDHLCRQRACCNPEHLEPVTCRENLLRGDTLTAAEAAATHCKRRHPFDETNTYWRADRPGVRGCKACRNSWRTRSTPRTA
jgi:hypothetical protein